MWAKPVWLASSRWLHWDLKFYSPGLLICGLWFEHSKSVVWTAPFPSLSSKAETSPPSWTLIYKIAVTYRSHWWQQGSSCLAVPFCLCSPDKWKGCPGQNDITCVTSYPHDMSVRQHSLSPSKPLPEHCLMHWHHIQVSAQKRCCAIPYLPLVLSCFLFSLFKEECWDAGFISLGKGITGVTQTLWLGGPGWGYGDLWAMSKQKKHHAFTTEHYICISRLHLRLSLSQNFIDLSRILFSWSRIQFFKKQFLPLCTAEALKRQLGCQNGL